MKPRAMLCSVAFFLLGVAALGVAGYMCCLPANSEVPGLVVEEPDRVFEGAEVNRRYELDFNVVNRVGQARRVIGSEFS
jgi:hypothetical protein